jgi:hypothetical protein
MGAERSTQRKLAQGGIGLCNGGTPYPGNEERSTTFGWTSSNYESLLFSQCQGEYIFSR